MLMQSVMICRKMKSLQLARRTNQKEKRKRRKGKSSKLLQALVNQMKINKMTRKRVMIKGAIGMKKATAIMILIHQKKKMRTLLRIKKRTKRRARVKRNQNK